MSLAQENTTSQETEQKSEILNETDPAPEKTVEREAVSKLKVEKRKKAMAGLAAICGIAILGIGAIAITMLWAKRLRRLARDLGPQQKTSGNDFWFLKPPKPIASEASVWDSHRPQQPPPTSESSETNE